MFRIVALVGVMVFQGLVFSDILAQELNPGSIDAGLLSEIRNSPEETFHEVFIVLKDRVNTEAFTADFLRSSDSRAQQTARMLEALQTKARATQAPVLEHIRMSGDADQSQVIPYWIANMVFVRAKKALIAELSQRADVSWIEKNEILEHEGVSAAAPPAPPLPNGREPGLTAINAPALWALGYTGYGRKILIVDSGQDPNHPALQSQFAYNYLPLTSAYLSSSLPDYCDPHGTGVASAAVGLDPLTRDTLGVAFNAQWIGAPISNLQNTETNERCVYKGSVKDVAGALQWALNPDGNTSTNDVPDVINNSYGRTLSSVSECSQVWPDLFRSLDAAGIVVVFAAGNEGPDPGSTNLQASISVNDVTPLSVGAINSSTKAVADFSGRGPSLCSNFLEPALDIKPEVVAPGVRIRVATTGKALYETVDGTSFAAPYVAGAVLLLKEAFPYLSGREIARALYQSAVDLGAAGEDNAYGKGLIDVLAAFNYLKGKGYQPIAPAAAQVDVANLSASPRLLNCGGKAFLEVVFRNLGTETVNALDIVVRREFTATPIFTGKWTGALAPGGTSSYMIPEFSASFGTYAVEVELKNPNGKEDQRPLNNQLKKKINVSPQPLLPSVTQALSSVCSGGRNLIASNYDGDGVLRWYNRAEGGASLAQGLSFYTGPLTQDTTFYAELRFNKKAGKPDNLSGETGLSDASTGGLLFDCLAPFTLKTVLVYADVAGPRNVRLKRPDGSIQQRLVNVSKAGANRVTLDFTIEPGDGYVLDISLGKELYISRTGTEFPYQIPGVLRIEGSENINPTYYSFFYDWEIEYNYPCGRLPVRVDVEAAAQGVKASFTGPGSALPLSNGEASVTFQNTSTGAAIYSWNFGDGNTSTETNPVHTYRSAGKFQVVLTASNGGTCSDIALNTVEIGSVTGIDGPADLDTRISVFPNPARGEVSLTLTLDRVQRVWLVLSDVLGRTVRTWDLGQVQERQTALDCTGLQAGSYQLTIMGPGFRHAKRLVLMD
ncbi:MAG: S8 family serine peptidase [Haliscomenobacter sp.]|nr:S8 family serine peptidase [Haliscomenobacter sp.]